MNYKKLIIMVCALHLVAFGLTACGKKKKINNNPVNAVCAPNDISCLNGITQQVAFTDTFGNYVPFYQNASVTDKSSFQEMMDSEFNGVGRNPYIGNWEWQNNLWDSVNRCHGSICRQLQIRILPLSGDVFSIVLRGQAIGHGPRVLIDPFGTSLENAPATSFVVQAQPRNKSTSVRFQSQSIATANPYPHQAYEHSRNHLYLDTSGNLSSNRLEVTLYYTGRDGRTRAVAQGTLEKDRDF